MLINQCCKGQGDVAWQSPKFIWVLGLFSLFIYGFLGLLWPGAGKNAGTLMGVLGLIMVLSSGQRIRKSAPLWLLLAAVIVQILSWCLGYLHHPEWIPDNPQIDRMGKWFLFVGVAWWLGGRTNLTLWLWCIAMVGFFLTTIVNDVGLNHWQRGLDGQRVDFGIHNAQHGAMYFGTILIGLLAFSRRLLNTGPCATPRRVFWVLSLAVSLTGVVVTQTRAIWLALLLALPIMAFLVAVYNLIGARRLYVKKKNIIFSGSAVLLVLVLLGANFHDAIEQRLGRENQVITNLIEGDIEAVNPTSSIGTRIYTWIAATEWIAQRPLVGWGEHGRSLAVKETDWLPESTKKNFGHLHNTFLEIMVAYGALGVFVVSVLAFWVGRGTWLSWRGGFMPSDMALFGSTFFIFWVVVNQFEAYLSFSSGVYVNTLVVGGLVTHIWRRQVALGGAPQSLRPE